MILFQAKGTITSILKDSRCKKHEKIKIIEALIKCGISCSRHDLDLVITSSNKVIKFDEKERQMMLLKVNDSVKNLAAMCRTNLRDHLLNCCHGKSIYRHVRQLPIPEILKDYLTYEGTFKVL